MDSLPHTRPRQVRIGELHRAIGEGALIGDPDAVVSGVNYDSQIVRTGDLFAALRGAALDGHTFIDRAIAAGSSALLVERTHDADVPQIVVSNSRAALASLSNAFYGNPSRELSVIGITGTDGKTTTSYLVDHILKESGIATGLIGTVGVRVGQGIERSLGHQTTPESNLLQGYLREMTEREVTHAVIEATSHGLAMHRLDGVRFLIAGVTNITREHLEYHGTVERYWRAKAMLVERVAAEGGTVVLNADDPGAMSCLPYAHGSEVVLTSATGKPVDLRATGVAVRAGGTGFTLHDGPDEVRIEMPLIGGFNVDNALIALGIGRAAGVPVEAMVRALGTTGGVPGRMQRIDEGQPFGVIVDFAHTPESLRKVLTLLRDLNQGRIIVVTGSAGERDTGKRPLQGEVCAELADLGIFTNEDPRHEDPERIIEDIAAGARSRGGIEGETFVAIVDRRAAIALAISEAAPGDLVLLAGKGHERSIIVGDDEVQWDEAAVARELLRERYGG